MDPEWRLSRPLRIGPTLFLAVGPSSWQGVHFLNDVAPAWRSCAKLRLVDAATTPAVIQSVFIISMILSWRRDTSINRIDFDRLPRRQRPSSSVSCVLQINADGSRVPCAAERRGSRNDA